MKNRPPTLVRQDLFDHPRPPTAVVASKSTPMADSGAGGGGGGKGGGGGGKGAGGGDGNDEKLAQFIAVTGVSSEDVANHWLEVRAIRRRRRRRCRRCFSFRPGVF